MMVRAWLTALLAMLVVSACSGDPQVNGDTDGDATDGDVTDGDVTDGDATDGDATDGDATDGDATDGDATDGDATDGDATDGDADGEDVAAPEPRCEVRASNNDEDCDGEPDSYCKRNEYNEHGLETLHEEDKDCDGVADYNCIYTTYDDGRMATYRSDPDCAVADAISPLCASYQYAVNGDLKRVDYDHGCLGAVSECVLYEYDANHNLLSQAVDTGCDGSHDRGCRYQTYDNRNLLIGEYNEDACDGLRTNCVGYTYNNDKRPLQENWDFDCDEVDDQCRLWSYTASGAVSESGVDDDCDGTADRECQSFTYNGRGLQALARSEEDCNGNAEVRETTYDDADRVTEIQIYYCGGAPETCGDPIVCSTITYDSDDQITRLVEDKFCNGPGELDDWCVDFAYDLQGNRTQETVDRQCDGVCDEIDNAEYVCFDSAR